MPISQIKTDGIASDAVTQPKIKDNITLDGTEFVRVPAGTTAQRPSSAAGGQLRFNTDIGTLEQYNTLTSAWQAIDSPPIITSVTLAGSATAANPAGGETVTITGSNFKAGATVTIGTTAASSVTINSTTQITITLPAKTAGDYDVKVTNTNGLAATATNAISYNGTPAFTTASGNLGSLAEDVAMSTITIVAAEPDGGTLAYSVTSGALPTGVSLGSANGQLTGTPNVNPSANTTFNFTVTATDDENQTNSRAFNLIVLRPIYATSIANSLVFNDNDSTRLYRTHTAGNRKTWTYSFWIKRLHLDLDQTLFHTGAANGNYFNMSFGTNNKIFISTWAGAFLGTTREFRDGHGWMHIVLAVDTTQATATDRFKIYVNGESQTYSTNSINSQFAQNADTPVNQAQQHTIGSRNPYNTDVILDAYLADVHFVDGSALAPTSFAESFNNVWVPKAYSGSYGTNGFKLDFADSAAPGNDVSGENHDWSATAFTASDNSIDSPTNNFATLSQITMGSSNSLKIGGLTINGVYSADLSGFTGSQFLNSGKWYWEVRANSTGTYPYIGITTQEKTMRTAASGSYYSIAWNAAGTAVSSGSDMGTITKTNVESYGNGDVIMIAVDVDARKIWWGENGTWSNSGNPANGTGERASWTVNEPITPSFMGYNGQGVGTNFNFGQDSTFAGNETVATNSDSNGIGEFHETVPAGFLAICSKNLSESSINTTTDDRPEDYFTTTLYVGDNSNDRTITTGFTPDFVWLKARNSTSTHTLYDSIRGNTHWISTVSNPAQVTNSSLGWGDSGPTTNGFKVYKGTNAAINNTGTNMVAWTWKAGGAPTASNSNTSGAMTANSVSLNGTLQSSYTPSGSPTQYPTKMSINTKAGFSIVGWTGAGAIKTLPHGLSSAPEMMVLKGTDARVWSIWHKDLTSGAYYVNFSSTNNQSSDNAMFNSAVPDANLFTIGTYNYVNTVPYFGYFWHSVPGYSKIGKYVGQNVANDGPFIELGFKPAWIMLKSLQASTPWQIYDNKRSPVNPVNEDLIAQGDNAEPYSTNSQLDFVANGFKLMAGGNNGWNNYNTGTWIYMAFAEDPFKYSEAR
jgi:hypothetical protein